MHDGILSDEVAPWPSGLGVHLLTSGVPLLPKAQEGTRQTGWVCALERCTEAAQNHSAL